MSALRACAVLTLACLAGSAVAAPRLFQQPAHQSPVRASADDLLLLPGTGLSASDEVYYTPLDGAKKEARVDVVSASAAPQALVLRLPPGVRSDRRYSLRVRTLLGEWSAPVTINDPRPLWFSPAYAYATRSLAGLPRTIRVVGRNLGPVQAGRATRVQLRGPVTLELTAGETPTAMADYVVEAPLPARLTPGQYRVSLSRDGGSWLELPDPLDVRADPAAPREFALDAADYGGCRPNDGQDDTRCLKRAVTAAQAAGGGVVVLGAGNWDLRDGGFPTTTAVAGIVLPVGVSLRGAGAVQTSLMRYADWNGVPGGATFTLLGRNTIEGIRFADQRRWKIGDPYAPFLRLGNGVKGGSVSDVVVTASVFDRTHPAIQDSAQPILRFIVAGNRFGAWDEAIRLDGDRSRTDMLFRVDDSVIRSNLFEPGSYMDLALRQGAIASEIGASRHLDFSDNLANGASTDFLDSPDDPSGWRAGFFFHMNNNHEMLLISGNQVLCPGDKDGDGEAISFDNNANTFALTKPARVLLAGADWIEMAEPLAARQNDRAVDTQTYYRDHWVYIVDGPGLGQARRISSYTTRLGLTHFVVTPAWDVQPTLGSSLMVGRLFWQAYVLGNTVDQRQPLCRKSNRTNRRGGLISIYGATADSVVAGNSQYDSDGIWYEQSYRSEDAECVDCGAAAFFQSSLEIRNNLIDGEYDWDSDCSTSGIQGSNSAGPDDRPPTVAFGISIDHNRIRRADGLRGGAISTPVTWRSGAAPYDWRLVQHTLIHHNDLSDLGGAPARPSCGGNDGSPRTGIALPSTRLVWHTTLYANRCTAVDRPIRDDAAATLKLCPTDGSASCECPAPPR